MSYELVCFCFVLYERAGRGLITSPGEGIDNVTPACLEGGLHSGQPAGYCSGMFVQGRCGWRPHWKHWGPGSSGLMCRLLHLPHSHHCGQRRAPSASPSPTPHPAHPPNGPPPPPRAGQKLRCVGSGLSPNGLAFNEEGMVSLALLDKIISIDRERMRVTVQAGARVEEVGGWVGGVVGVGRRECMRTPRACLCRMGSGRSGPCNEERAHGATVTRGRQRTQPCRREGAVCSRGCRSCGRWWGVEV